jgi:hypothetical protein
LRIVEQSKDRLVLDIRPIGLMILCVGLFILFLLLGFGMKLILPFLINVLGFPDLLAISGGPGPVKPGLLGYASIIPLLVAVFLLKTRRLTFDRTSGKVTVASRGMLGRSEVTFPLSGFRGASLARSRSGTSGTAYRAILQFADQTVPVTPYGTSGSGPARTAEAINGWLGPTITAQGQNLALTGDQAAKVAAALETLGIKLPR